MKLLKCILLSLITLQNASSMGGKRPPSNELRDNTMPDLVAAWYHHWWVPGRFDRAHKNHRYEPELGHYSMTDETVDQHIAWAKRAGINALNPNFWLTSHDWYWVKPHTDLVTKKLDEQGMQYFFLIDHDLSNGGWQKYSPNEIANLVVQKASPYFNQKGYVRIDNKPVIFFWGAYGSQCSFWHSVRQRLESQIGAVVMTGDAGGDNSCFDIQMMYNPYAGNEPTHSGQLRRQENLWKGRNKKKLPWVPTALAGYDDTRVRQGNPPIALDGDFFRSSIQTSLKYKQYLPNGQSWLLINSWNEFHEGSNIEPSNALTAPFLLLEILKRELDQF